VLILGYNPTEPNWEQTVWGTPPDKAGRLVRGIAVALEENAELIVITGGAVTDEAIQMKKRLYRGLKNLKEFTIYPVFERVSVDKIKEKLDRCLRLEEKAQNTTENISLSGKFFREAHIEKIIIVTSPDHISRAIRDTIRIWSDDYPELVSNLFGTAAVTFYSERSSEDREIAKMENIVIAEPPVMKKFNLGRLFGILRNKEALDEIDRTLKKYGK